MATKIYVGDSVKNAIEAKPKSLLIKDIFQKMGLSRTQFYTVINSPEMRVDHVIKFGEIFNKDFYNHTEKQPLQRRIAELEQINHDLQKENYLFRKKLS